MDNDSPVSRVERTFWTVWYYITGAVSRFLSPDPTNTVRHEPDSFQDSAADSEPANCGHAEGNAGEMEVVGELPLATVSVVSLSQPLVAWELPTTDIDLGPDEERVQFKTQLSRGSEGKASDEAEDMTEEQFALTGNDGAGLLIPEDAKENKEEENGAQILSTHRLDEMQENDEYEEHMSTRSSGLTGDAVNEDVEERGRQAVAEEEMTPDDRQKMDENLTKIETEEEDKMLHEDEQDLKAEDVEVKLCTVTALSLEEGGVHIEEAKVQRDMADTAVKHEGVEETDGALLLASENENKSDERTRQAENQLIVCEDLADYDRNIQENQSFTSLHAELQMDKSPSESTLDQEQGVVTEEKKGSEAANQTTDEMPAQEDNIKSVTEGQEEEISTRHVTVGEEFMQNALTELHPVEFTVGEQEGVAKDTGVQTNARETDDVKTESHGEVIEGNVYMTTGNISVDEKFIDKDQVETERLLSERDGKESYMEVACTATSVTVKPEGETGQEISGEFKNTPPGICEGQFVVSQELNSPACEETQEGVPEYNNEPGPDENTTQRFLEEGDCKEIQNTQLPEEVESKELESFQNSDCGSGADFLFVREHIEEEQERTEDIKNSFELVVEQDTGILHLTDAGLSEEGETPLAEPVIQGSGLLFEEEKGHLLVDSMKAVIEHSEKESEMHMGLTDETDATTKLLRDETEEIVVEKDELLCDIKEADGAGDHHEMTGAIAAEEVVGLVDGTSKFPKAEVQKITETHREREDILNSEQNSCRTSSLVEDITESGFLKQLVESEPKLPGDIAVEMQDASIHMEKIHYRVEEEAEEYEVQNKNEIEILNLQLAEMAAGPTTEKNEKENTLTAESESPGTQNQLSAESLEISNKETEASGQSVTSDSEPNDLTAISEEEISKPVTESEGSYAEGSVSLVGGHQDVIDEEILDLWIQTALSEDTDGTKQEGPEPGQQMHRELEPSKEEQNETSSVQTEKDKEQLVESNSGESELVSDPEMSSSAGESGFLDKSPWEWGAQNNETQLLTSSSTGSIQGVCDMLSNMSESTDISELSTHRSNSESQEILMEEATETVQSNLKEEESVPETGSHHHNSGVTSSEASHLDQDLDTLRDDTEEETGSKKETNAEVTDLAMKTSWKDTLEAGAKSLTEMSTLLKAEEIEVEDEPLDMTVSDSPEGTEHTDSGCSRSGSEASLKEEILSTDSGSQDGSCTESEKELLKLPTLEKPQTEQSEDDIDLLAGLNKAEVTEELTTEAEDQLEVDASVLDFTAQRSRIAVKNPRVRPPKDPRSLLHKPSVDPTPSSRLPVKIPAGVPLGGLGIGIKLPGLGAGIPVLKKTQRVVRDENSQEVLSQKPETNPEEKRNTPKPDEAQHKPKWMPPRQPGFGNPLMSELKTKLKKTPKSD